MISLIISFIVLILGYLTYGKLTEKVFGPDGRTTPANRINDGVDFVPMKTWKAFLIQFLNIAGTGPIFGALMGACFGPVVFLWIVLGSVLGGAVHDFMVGMISERHDGKSIAELSGIYMGNVAKWGMRLFSVLLLLLTGTVFVNSPTALIAQLTPESLNTTFFIDIYPDRRRRIPFERPYFLSDRDPVCSDAAGALFYHIQSYSQKEQAFKRSIIY